MAKRTIANLNIQLSASSATLRRDFQQASGTVNTFGANVAAVAAKVAGALAAMFAVGRLRSTIADQLGSIDQLGKFSDEIGVTTQKLQAYHLQAQLTGTSVESLDKGMQRFVRALGEAKAGYGEGAKGFEALNLSAERLNSMDTASAFEETVEAIRQLPTVAERAAAAYQLFGRQGQELMTFFAGGSAGIKSAADDLARVGAEVSRIDAAKVEAANDAVTRMQTAASGLATSMTVALAPAIQAVAQGTTELTAFVGSLDTATVGNIVKMVAFVAAFAAALKIIPMVISAIKGIITAIRAMTAAQAISQAFGGPAGWATLAASAAIAAGAVYGVSEAFSSLSKDADQTVASASQAAGTVREEAEATADATEQMADHVKAAADRMEGLKRRADSLTESLSTPVERFRDDMAELQELAQSSLISPETAQRAGAKYRAELEEALKAQQQITGLQDRSRGVGAVTYGTTAGFSAVQTAVREQREQLRVSRLQLAKQEAIRSELDQIEQNTREQLRVQVARI